MKSPELTKAHLEGRLLVDGEKQPDGSYIIKLCAKKESEAMKLPGVSLSHIPGLWRDVNSYDLSHSKPSVASNTENWQQPESEKYVCNYCDIKSPSIQHVVICGHSNINKIEEGVEDYIDMVRTQKQLIEKHGLPLQEKRLERCDGLIEGATNALHIVRSILISNDAELH